MLGLKGDAWSITPERCQERKERSWKQTGFELIIQDCWPLAGWGEGRKAEKAGLEISLFAFWSPLSFHPVSHFTTPCHSLSPFGLVWPIWRPRRSLRFCSHESRSYFLLPAITFTFLFLIFPPVSSLQTFGMSEISADQAIDIIRSRRVSFSFSIILFTEWGSAAAWCTSCLPLTYRYHYSSKTSL